MHGPGPRDVGLSVGAFLSNPSNDFKDRVRRSAADAQRGQSAEVNLKTRAMTQGDQFRMWLENDTRSPSPRRACGPCCIMSRSDGGAAIRDGSADAALLRLGSDDLTGLQGVEVGSEDPVVPLRSDHAMAGRAEVRVAELQDVPGYRARCPAVGLDEIVDRVALGRLVTVVGSAATDRLPREVTAVPVRTPRCGGSASCWAAAHAGVAAPALRTVALPPLTAPPSRPP